MFQLKVQNIFTLTLFETKGLYISAYQSHLMVLSSILQLVELFSCSNTRKNMS